MSGCSSPHLQGGLWRVQVPEAGHEEVERQQRVRQAADVGLVWEVRGVVLELLQHKEGHTNPYQT